MFFILFKAKKNRPPHFKKDAKAFIKNKQDYVGHLARIVLLLL